MKKLRTALVGAGYVSRHHLRGLKVLDFVEVVGIADLDVKRAKSVADEFGISSVFRDFRELGSIAPDVIHVLTPPDSHCLIAIEALENGCHVLVEKPMAESTSDCERMIAAAKSSGRVLSVNHSARMDPVVLRGADLVASGAIGSVIGVDFLRSSDYPAHRGGLPLPPQFRTGAYPLQDLGVHGFTIIETFLGMAHSADIKFWSTNADPNLTFDEWRGTVECERGVGHVYFSWNARPIRSEIFVHGTRGTIHIDCFLQTCTLSGCLPGPKFLSNVAGALRSSISNLITVPANVFRFATGKLQGAPGIHVSIAKFYESLRVGSPPPVSAEEGRRIISLMEPACIKANHAKVRATQSALSDIRPARNLVTGAAGFVGRHLVQRLLKDGEHLRVLVRRPVPDWGHDPRVQVICGDLGDPEIVDRAIAGVKTVYHVGAAMKGSAADFERGTIWGTRNVVEACEQHGVECLVYVSSLSLLDHAGHDPKSLVTEDSAFEPKPELRGSYTQTKLVAEQIVRDAIAQRNLPAVILRPGQIFGPGAEHVPPPGVISFGRLWLVVGSGRRLLPLVHVDDVIDGLIRAAKCGGATGKIYNIVDTTRITQTQYLRSVRPQIRDVRVLCVPQWFMLGAAWGCECMERIIKRPLPLSRYRVRSIRPLALFDITAAKRDLHWIPTDGRWTVGSTEQPERQIENDNIPHPVGANVGADRDEL